MGLSAGRDGGLSVENLKALSVKTLHVFLFISLYLFVFLAEHRQAPERTWTPGGGIEIPCTYTIYTAKIHKKNVREKIRAAQNLYL